MTSNLANHRRNVANPCSVCDRAGTIGSPSRKMALPLLLAMLVGAMGCAGSNTCPPSAYPQYPAYPTAYPGQPAAYGMPNVGTPPSGMPPGAMPPGTIPMTGQPPVYGQPMTGGYPAYPTAGASMPPGYAQPMVGR